MAYADDIRTTDYTREELATLIEGVLGASAGLITWSDWSPTWGGGGSMTYTSVTTTYARYIQIGPIVLFNFFADGTTGGTADTRITFTLPVTAAQSTGQIGSGAGDVASVSAVDHVQVGLVNSTTGFLRLDNLTNWRLGSGTTVLGMGIYEAA